MKVVFVGYMASGKSAVANEVAAKLDLKRIDLDDFIEEKEGATISDIFKEKGEVYFRRKETEYLTFLLESTDSFILSVGGGTPCFTGNMELILEKSTSIYLKASIHTIYNRLLSEKSKRPLVASIADENLQEFIAKHLFERAPYYEQSNNIVEVNDKSIAEIANQIIEKL